MSYWTNQGKYEEEAQELNELMPAFGPAETLKGEIWRAASKIYYDYFNNGWGNIWVLPAAFLLSRVDLPAPVRQSLFEHAKGNIAYADYEEEMEQMINCTIEALRDMGDEPLDQDMWDFKVSYEFESMFSEEELEDEDY